MVVMQQGDGRLVMVVRKDEKGGKVMIVVDGYNFVENRMDCRYYVLLNDATVGIHENVVIDMIQM